MGGAVSRPAEPACSLPANETKAGTFVPQTAVGLLKGAVLANLRLPAAPTVTSDTLWASNPQVILVLRRPGCQLCRTIAKKLQALKPQLDAMNVGTVCLVQENIPAQIEEFVREYWSGPLYLDTELKFYKALGSGKIRRGSLASFLNPWSTVWSRASDADKLKVKGNLTGEGQNLGGMYVMAKGGAPVFEFVEANFGDHASDADVLEAARRAAAQSK